MIEARLLLPYIPTMVKGALEGRSWKRGEIIAHDTYRRFHDYQELIRDVFDEEKSLSQILHEVAGKNEYWTDLGCGDGAQLYDATYEKWHPRMIGITGKKTGDFYKMYEKENPSITIREQIITRKNSLTSVLPENSRGQTGLFTSFNSLQYFDEDVLVKVVSEIPNFLSPTGHALLHLCFEEWASPIDPPSRKILRTIPRNTTSSKLQRKITEELASLDNHSLSFREFLDPESQTETQFSKELFLHIKPRA